jgi:tetratricopeptide (TPR) repeat protein
MNANAYYNAGVRYQQANDCGRARGEFDKAIQLEPDFAQAYYLRGIANECLGLGQSAINDYSRVIELNPLHAGAMWYRGRAYERARNYPVALENYSQSIALQPTNSGVYQARALLFFGPLQDPGRAIPDFTRCIELGAGNPNPFCIVNRGRAYERVGEIQLAIADLELALVRFGSTNEAERTRIASDLARLRALP